MSRPTYAEVDLGAVRHNLRTLRACLATGTRMLGVVKADAYGHGAVAVSRTLEAGGIDMLGAALVEEGIALRVEGIRAPILVMGVTPADEIPAAMQYDLAITVGDLEAARGIQDQAARHGRKARVHLKIDTGMNRLGIRAEEVGGAAAAIVRMKGLVLEGAYTHFACADGEKPGAVGEQLARLRAALAAMRSAGAVPPLVHAANSSALMAMPDTHFDMVRSGLALYGIATCGASAGEALRPVLALKSEVAHLKRVRRGEGASYGHRWQAKRDSVLGFLPIGYADGYPRALWERGRVRVGGRLAPIAGVVCMDATLVDLTDIENPHVGMLVTLIEADCASPISAAGLAALCGTIPYEILTGLGKRLPRVYR
jgi:alanine racemase